MNKNLPITTLFLDIGGVLLTNGWDRYTRKLAADTFHLDFTEMDERHHLTYDTYESGKLSLVEYLNRVVFYEKRPFSMDEFRTFMFSCSKPYNNMIELVKVLKTQYHLKTIAVSNEGRELTGYRIQHFNLLEVIDAFVSSSYVHFRKPDMDMYKIALDISQSLPEQVVYIDDRRLFVEVAEGLGIHGVHHSSYKETYDALAELGLKTGLKK
jgi:putative hydrolase of the HAD superfamily